MITKKITYTNYNGEEITREFMFNLSKAELVHMEYTTPGGFKAYVQSITEAKDVPALYSIFEKIVRESYGEKSPDGERFLKLEADGKTPKWVAFSQTEAYSELIVELVTNTDAAIQFIKGVGPTPVDIPEGAIPG